MRVAALLGFLAALPAHAGDAVTPAQARASVVQALPPEIAKGAGNTDLRTYLERLPPDQKKAALASLTAKEGDLGKDPATLGVIGQAYAGLGKVKEARQAAQNALRQNPNDPQARQIMAWVTTQEKLAERGSSAGSFAGDTGGPGGGGQAPRSAGGQANLNSFQQKVQSLFNRGQKSDEFKNTMHEAGGFSVAALEAEGIAFKPAPAEQRDAVNIDLKDGKFTVYLRDDALNTGGDREARGAANTANGVRQVVTKKEHPIIGDAIILARGWFTGAKTHRELAPNDIEARPATPSDQNLMAARKIIDQKNSQFDKTAESYGGDAENGALGMFNSLANVYGPEVLLERFMKMTGRAK